MKELTALLHSPRFKIVLFICSIALSVFYYCAVNVNVYKWAVLGALFEYLSLPMLGLLLIVPVVSLYLTIKEKFSMRSLALYALIISLVALTIVIQSTITDFS